MFEIDALMERIPKENLPKEFGGGFGALECAETWRVGGGGENNQRFFFFVSWHSFCFFFLRWHRALK